MKISKEPIGQGPADLQEPTGDTIKIPRTEGNPGENVVRDQAVSEDVRQDPGQKRNYPKRNSNASQADGTAGEEAAGESSAASAVAAAQQQESAGEEEVPEQDAVKGAAGAGASTGSAASDGTASPAGRSGSGRSRRPLKKKKKRIFWKALLCLLLIIVLITGGIYIVPTKAYGRVHDGVHHGVNGLASGAFSLFHHGNKSSSRDDGNSEKADKDQEQNYKFSPHAVESTEPSRLIKSTQIQVDGKTLPDISEYKAEEKIEFGTGDQYTEVDGIITFRGNNFRDSASYGTADITDKTFSEKWTKATSALTAPDGEFWSGNGWTGQPLIVTWSKETRQNMYMESWAQEADRLTEVIYASLDGHIYFLDLKTGKETRPAMELGYTFKGAGALDPRGYPIMYVGSGYDSKLGRSHAFIINLLDCKVMHEFGRQDPFSLRGNLSFFDSSPLVDAETDQLIYPGENGILYIMKLNTKYNEEKGTLSIDPQEPVRWHYSGNRSWYLGMEDSALIWKGYIFFTTNDGYMFCLNLNTLETVWVQDVLDDTNCTPVLELEDGHPYIYTSTSFHLGWRSNTTAEIPVWKIDAETGEILWSTSYQCRSVKGNSGGVQGTLAIGKNDLKDLIFVPVAKTPTVSSGKIVALNKETGEEVWVLEDSAYSWSSPVTVYSKKGKGYVITCDSIGDMYLLDGKTGEVLDKMNLGGNVEASPAVYKDTLVVGTRTQKIFGIKLQ